MKFNSNTNISLLIILVVVALFYYGPRFLSPTEKPAPEPIEDTISYAVDPSAPTLEAIAPVKAKIGSTIKVTGANLAGFEGDKKLWMENTETREKGVIVGTAGSTDTLIRFTLMDQYCGQDNSFVGKDCFSSMKVTPGTYVVYAEPWGRRSNLMHLQVTQ